MSINEEDKREVGTVIKTYQGKIKTESGQEHDFVIVWYRDKDCNKKVKLYYRPIVPYYILKDKNSPEAYAPPLYISEDKVDKIEVPSDQLFRDIAIRTGATAYYDNLLLTKGANCYEMKNLFRHKLVYDADMNLSDRIIYQFQQEFKADPEYKIHKCYFDIEVDLMPDGFKKNLDGTVGYVGFPEENIAPCPINIITLIDAKTMMIYSFVVENRANASLMEFKSNLEKYRATVLEKIHKEDDPNIVDSKVFFYQSEEECIEAFFKKCHEVDPDYLAAWNECFDAITMMNRLVQLYSKKQMTKAAAKEHGVSVMQMATKMMYDVVCDEKYREIDGHRFPAYAKYNAKKNDQIGKRIDFFNVLDGINWYDSEYYFSLVHASEGKKDSYKLDFISELVLHKHKREFERGEDIKNQAWVNFAHFYEYNVRDVLLLHLLEEVNLDIDTLQRLSEVTNTRKEKVFVKSTSLANFVNAYSRMEHHVMNCNKNQVYASRDKSAPDIFKQMYLGEQKAVEPDENYSELFEKKDKFGAVVSNPMLNDHCGEQLFDDELSMHVFKNLMDQDLSSLYPSIIRAFNLDSSTEVGKFFLRDDMLKARLKEKYDYYGLFTLSDKDDDSGETNDDDDISDAENNAGETNDLGTTFTDELISQNWSSLGEKFFILPSIDEIYDDLDEIVKNKRAAV